MACNFGPDKKSGKGGGKGEGLCPEDESGRRVLLSAASTATSTQNGDHAKCEAGQTSEQEAPERRRPEHKPPAADELPRRSFQIPRKIKERKGLLQHLFADSREFEEVMKLLSTSYLDPNSRGTFTYTKASLVHNELLEKEFIEKKREMKQNGRTEAELLESFAFLLPDKNKVHWICEKGLSVGHSRVSNLGPPVKGVYLSKYSDLLQMNPFEVGATGEIIIFKVMKGRVKTIFENVPKSNLEPVPKCDSHVYKNASKVTSLLSYRAFEHTQQYFYEFAFDELRPRPRHVLPYAVLSFQFKGKESVTAAHSRLNSIVYEGPRVRRRYTLWSGSLVNKGQEVCQVSIRASNLPVLPLKIPEKLDVDMAMHIEQVRKKIPGVLSWETYSGSQEVLKCGMFCSLYELIGKNKPENSVSGILQRLEEERMVLVKPLPDKGFLFIISSSQLHKANEKRGRHERGLMALFIFQEPRICSRTMLRRPGAERDCRASPEPKDPVLEHLYQLTPALHHGLCKLRLNPPKELAGGVKRHALDYLRSQQERGPLQTFYVPEYRHNLDNKTALHTTPRPKNMDAAINSYFYSPGQFQLPGEALLQGVVDSRPDPGSTPPPPPAEVDESSPVSDWGGVSQPNGGVAMSQGQYNKEKMEKLLKLIQMHKRTLGKDEVGTREDELDALTLKRKLEREGASSVSKYLKSSLFNGAPGRVGMGLCDTDLRENVAQNSSVGTANNLLKIIFNTLMAQKSGRLSESLDSYDLAPPHDLDLRNRQTEEDLLNDFSEDQTPRSSVDVYSPSSGVDQPPSRLSEASQQTNHSWKMFLADDFVEACVSEGEKQESSSDPVDFILDKELSNLGVAIQKLMDGERIVYTPQASWPRRDERDSGLHKSFSHFISQHVSPLPLQGYLNTFCERMNQVMAPLGLSAQLPSPPAALKPAPLARPPASLAKPHANISKPPPSAMVKDEAWAGRSADPKSPALCSPSTGSASHTSTPSVPDIPPEPSLSALSSSVSDVIGHIQPDVLCTLMEIVQKNAVRFYIQTGDEESQLCTEIRAYLKSLGNVECNPQNYLEIRSQQKFMIIIQNQDIAPHVHEIPALVRLKKLPTVYFAGVDSLDDVKNRTYNELFVSGGLIVSDEMILNPDCITLGKLQSFLQFLEDQGSLWKWKVHCKTQKKLKELSRLNTEALDLLNVLTAYQKKHLVEFLPYHECDTPSRPAPDLQCLVKLQAQHTQLRHIVFLTEKHDCAVSQFSGSGVIVARMSDIINDFQCLISRPGEAEVAPPTAGTTPQPDPSVSCPVEPDALVDEEDMSLDSDDDSTAIQTDAFLPPHAGTHLEPAAFSSQPTYPVDYAALETALTRFNPACPEGGASTETDHTLSSFGVNPHQSYLCAASAQWSPFPAPLAFAMPAAYSSPGGVADYPSLPTGVTPPSHLPQAPPTPESSQQTPAPAPPESAANPTTPAAAQDEAAYPSYPDAGGFPALTPIPPVPALFNWGQMAGSQHRSGFSKPEPSDGAWTGTSENGGSQVQEDTSPHLLKEHTSGAAEGLTSPAQGSRTPLDSSSSRGLLPVPGAPVGPLCRGNPRGLFTPPDVTRGGFRGRGMPQFPVRSRPGRGQVRGGPSCNWGYPPGRGGGGWSDYHPDYTYN